MLHIKNNFLIFSLFITMKIGASFQHDNNNESNAIDNIISSALDEKESHQAAQSRKADERYRQYENEINHRKQLLKTYKSTNNPTILEDYLVAQSKNHYSMHRWFMYTGFGPRGVRPLEDGTLEQRWRQFSSLFQTKYNHVQKYALDIAEDSSSYNIEDRLLSLDYDISFFNQFTEYAQNKVILDALATNQLQYLTMLLVHGPTRAQAHDSCYNVVKDLITNKANILSGHSPKTLNNGERIRDHHVLISNLLNIFDVNYIKKGNNLLMSAINEGITVENVTMLMEKGIDIHYENHAENKNALDVGIEKYLRNPNIGKWSNYYEKHKVHEDNLLTIITLLTRNNVLAHEQTISMCVKDIIDQNKIKNAHISRTSDPDFEIIQTRTNLLKTIPVRYK